MKKIETILAILLVLCSILNMNAQEFKFKKKLNKYVFKSEKGKFDESKAFDEVDYKGSLEWYVRNGELWGVVNKEGEFLLPVKFEQIDFCHDKKNLVKMVGVWGEYIEEKFTPKEGEIVFVNPQVPPFLTKCKDVDHDKCLIEEIYYNLRYPAEAFYQKIEGPMIAELIINEKGQVESYTMKKKIGGGCEEEFIRLIETYLQQWEPGKNDGIPVKSRKVIPLRMKLE
ncbi:MAG: energy transducer TonB [Saprospiraceae bacterium]